MRILFNAHYNPHYMTISTYTEKALREMGHEVFVYEKYQFMIPGRIRDRVGFLQTYDVNRINRKLVKETLCNKAEVYIDFCGYLTKKETIREFKKNKIITILWIIDVPYNFENILNNSSEYDHIFCVGTEAKEILSKTGVTKVHWAPIGCDPDIHRKRKLDENEKKRYGCDIAFVGSLNREFYSSRVKILESLADYDLGIWGAGSEMISSGSPIRRFVKGRFTAPEEWTKIYSASKIVLALHYSDPKGLVPSNQVSSRVFEALSCGSFVISDNQKDLGSLFKDGEHLVIFKDIPELKEKVRYYLNRPEERAAIARNGCEEATKKHSFRKHLEEVFSIITGK